MKTFVILLLGGCVNLTSASASAASGADADALFAAAITAERRHDSQEALRLLQQVEPLRPDDPVIAQKIARQYSDAIVDLPSAAEKRRYAEQSLAYARRAAELEPDNAVNVLSVAIALGQVATQGDIRTKVDYAREIKIHAERAVALDPDYAWAHHVLGRWHREVADLNGIARWWVGFAYGGLPDADLATAITHLQRAVELEPNNPNHHLELGLALRDNRQADLARPYFETAAQLPAVEKHDDLAISQARAMLKQRD